MWVVYVMLCYVISYVIKTLGKKELVTMNNRKDDLRKRSKVLATN